MDIPVNPKTLFADGYSSRSIDIVLDQIKEGIHYLVVEESNLLEVERLVPKENIAESSQDVTRLICSRDELSGIDPLYRTDFLRSEKIEFSVPSVYPCSVPVLVRPYIGRPRDGTIIKCEHKPLPELAILRKASPGN